MIHIVTSQLEYQLLFLLYHLVPACFIDIGLRFSGSKLRLVKVYSKIYYHLQSMVYFMNSTWKFDDTKMRKLYSNMSSDDLREFPCILKPEDLEPQLINSCHGTRKYYFKESDEDLPRARRKYKIFEAIHYLFLTIFVSALGYFIYCIGAKYFLAI